MKPVLLLSVFAACLLVGCGTPGVPLPPSLHLAAPVADLVAQRTGDRVELHFTLPRRNTEKLLLTDTLSVTLCRQQPGQSCQPIAHLGFAPGVSASYVDPLPADLASGPARLIQYAVELPNRSGHSAGLSNLVVVLAGKAPAPVHPLHTALRKDGVVLSWQSEEASVQPPPAIRLNRQLLNPPAHVASGALLSAAPEPLEQTLTAADLGHVLDTHVRFGQRYQYRAQRFVSITVDGRTLELDGPWSDAVSVDVLDQFPPSVPTGLVAVASNTSGASIDLSWQPVTDQNLAGYVVYRRQPGSDWKQVTSGFLSPAPSFHDANVQPGQSYDYSIAAVATNGRSSPRTASVTERAIEP